MAEKENMGVLKELLSGIRGQLSERLVSPLMPSIVISWLIVNYRFVLVMFSGESFEKKFSYIDTVVFRTTAAHLINGLIIPIVIGIAYILIYPYPAKWFYSYSLKRQRELHEIRLEAEEARMLSIEESKRLRAYYYDQEMELRNEIQSQQERIEQLTAKIRNLENNDKSRDFAKSRAEKLDPEKLTLNEAKVLEVFRDWDDQKRTTNLNETDIDMFLQDKNVSIPFGELRIILADLDQYRYIQHRGSDAEGVNNYSFTNEGRKAFKEYQEIQENPFSKI